MKLALISDIHGNLFAFDAVLEDIRRRKIEQILDKLVLNPGSVGQPLDRIRAWKECGARNPPWGEYAILTIEGNQFSVELLRVPFDLAGLLTLLSQRSMPHTEWLVNSWSKA